VPRTLRQKVALLWPHLDERARRLFAASETRQLGHGGVSHQSRVRAVARHFLCRLDLIYAIPSSAFSVRRSRGMGNGPEVVLRGYVGGNRSSSALT